MGTDTKKQANQEGYGNTHGIRLRRAMNEIGLIDAYNLVNGNKPGGFTRLSGTVHTRIDRIYTPAICSNINWQTIGPHPTLFTGKGASDHLPVIGTFEMVGYKTGRTYDIRVDSELFAADRRRHPKGGDTSMEKPHQPGDLGRKRRRRLGQRQKGGSYLPSMGNKTG